MRILKLILKKTYSDNCYYLIHSTEVMNLPNISKVLSKVLLCRDPSPLRLPE